MYEHMEGLAQLNMALVQQRKQSPHETQRLQLMALDESVQTTKASRALDERVQRLQATIVQQTKTIEGLRRQLKTMVPTLPLDGATQSTRYDSDEDSNEAAENRDDTGEKDPACSGGDRGLCKLPLTSLHAQLKGRDAKIRRLEQHAAQVTQELDATREKKRQAVRHYQQITNSQQSELRKYTASVEAQLRTQRSLERRIQELAEYVDVLERKLLIVGRST